MIKSTIGCQMTAEGAIEGFADANANMAMEGGEERLFLVEIDAERSRLIASDTHNNNRDHHYRFRPGRLLHGLYARLHAGAAEHAFRGLGREAGF